MFEGFGRVILLSGPSAWARGLGGLAVFLSGVLEGALGTAGRFIALEGCGLLGFDLDREVFDFAKGCGGFVVKRFVAIAGQGVLVSARRIRISGRTRCLLGCVAR